jgi:uncharacterized membrane protein YbhN (UPF0104 family)
MNKHVKSSIGVLVSVVILYFLFQEIAFADIVAEFHKVTWFTIGAVFALYGIMFILRSYQMRALITTDASYPSLFGIAALHNFLNMVLPARLGELSLLYYLRQKKVHIAESASKLLFMRISDIGSVLIAFVAAIAMAGTGTFQPLSVAIGTVLVLALVALILLFLLNIPLLIRAYDFLTKPFPWNVLKRLRAAALHMSWSIRRLRAKQVYASLAASAGIWISKYFVYAVILNALRVPLTHWQIILAITAVAVISSLPFYSFGGFGAIEGTLAGMFVLFGIASGPAIAVAFTLHIIQFTNYIAYGLIGYVLHKTT